VVGAQDEAGSPFLTLGLVRLKRLSDPLLGKIDKTLRRFKNDVCKPLGAPNETTQVGRINIECPRRNDRVDTG
jgi:hypothetical protein